MLRPKSPTFLERLWGTFFPTYKASEWQVTLDNRWNLNYVGQIHVGTPQASFWVVYDTGSGTFLLKSTKCTSCDPDKLDVSSSTYVDLGYTDGVTYLDGTSLTGDVSTETICV